MRIFVYFFLFSRAISLTKSLLFSKSATNLGLVASVSLPVTDSLPDQRIVVDWCFSMGYDLPGTLKPFYNVPIWPVKLKNKRSVNRTEHYDYYLQDLSSKYQWLNVKTNQFYDFTAAELYKAVEIQLERYNIDKSCLLQSVCYLAQHPFKDGEKNLFTDILTFFLSPSLHQGFHFTEKQYRRLYEEAEFRGFSGRNCTSEYPDCNYDLLSFISFVI